MKKNQKAEVVELAEIVELRKIYKDARDKGIFVREFPAEVNYLAVAGSVKRIETYERLFKMEIDVGKLTLGHFFEFGPEVAELGTGPTRSEACLNAIAEFKKHNRIK